MKIAHPSALAALLIVPPLLSLACVTSVPAGPAPPDPSNHTPVPVTPRITLPPEWTVAPDVTATPIPGWEEFQGRGVSLWLPESFFGGDPGQHLDATLEELRRLGGHFAESADTLQADPSSFALWMFDSTSTASGALTNVTAIRDEVPPAVPMQEVIDAVVQGIPPEMRVVQSGTVTLSRYPEAALLVIEIELEGVAVKEAAYLVKDGADLWVITYATGAAEFDQMLPTFELSISTLRVGP